MARASAKGGFNLFWGLTASTIISAIGFIILARLLSPPEYGIVTIALTAPHLITIFTELGVNSAMIKYTAQYRAEEKAARVKNILTAGLVFQVVLGGFLTFLAFLFSGFLATNIFQRSNIEPLIRIASFTIFAGVLTTTAQSAFTGYERMELYSATMSFQAIVKAILAPALVVIGLGAFGAILGTSIAFLTSGLISMVIFYLTLYKDSPNPNSETPKTPETIKTMLKYGLPLSISSILAGFLLQFSNFLVAIYCTDAAIGNYYIAVNFSVLITFFVTPITTVLFPVFSKLNPNKENEILKNVFRFSVKYAALLVAPAAAALIALAEPAVTTLFGQQYTEAPLYVALYFLIYLYSAFGSLSISNLLNGLGKTQVTLKLTLASFAIGLPLSLLLIPKFGIPGLIVTALAAGIPDLTLGLWWIKKHYTLAIDWVSSIKILVASAAATAITYVAISQLSLPSWIKLAIGTGVFLATYITTIPLIGAINKTDTQNLKQMLNGLGPISNLLKPPLNIMEKLARSE